MGNKNNKKERINVVYSTNPNYQYEYNQEEEQETLAPEKQNLRVTLDSKQRKGKIVTLVQGFGGYGRESERTGQATEKQMWRGRLRERWRNYHPRGSKRKSVDYSPGQ